MLNSAEWRFFKRAIMRYLDRFKKIQAGNMIALITFLHEDDRRFIGCRWIDIVNALNDLIKSSDVRMGYEDGNIVFYVK